MKDIIPLTALTTEKQCIQSLTEHNRIYCPICHRTNAVGLSGWYGIETFVLKFGCHFCEARMEYRRNVVDALPSELGAYRDQYFAEALRHFAATVAGGEPSENIHLLIYPKDAIKIGRQLKIVWNADKGGEVIEKDEERESYTFQESSEEDESA